VAEKMGIDLIWFGVILAMNMQTSFLTPPFGFSLFYLRGVAPASVKTTQIYKGSVAFIVLQLIMVAAILFNPELVTGQITKGPQINVEDALQQMREAGREAMKARGAAGEGPSAEEDPMKGLLDAIKEEQKKK
jgi:hypothetical protein